jgi:hypothetical protein
MNFNLFKYLSSYLNVLDFGHFSDFAFIFYFWIFLLDYFLLKIPQDSLQRQNILANLGPGHSEYDLCKRRP